MNVDISMAADRIAQDLAAPVVAGQWPRGVIGAHSADGQARYGYPEIAGYWLRWASSEATVDLASGEAVVDWLQGLSDDGLWPTRVAAPGQSAPDHQDRHYLFDHAMLWDGLHRWAQRRSSSSAAALAQVLRRRFFEFRLGTQWQAMIGAEAESAHWSAAGGPFLLKAWARLSTMDDDLGREAQAQSARLRPIALHQPHTEAHPQLYALEGLLESGDEDGARAGLVALLQTQGDQPVLPESADGGPRRSDVQAQLIRLGLRLGLVNRQETAWRSRLQWLLDRIDRRGRVQFSDDQDGCPTWAALFSLQALRAWMAPAGTTMELI